LDLIIVDDASTDGSVDLLRWFVESYCLNSTLILRDENQGGTKTLCDGLSLARGEYVAVLELDDFWHNTDRLQIALDFLIANPAVCSINDGIRTLKNGVLNSSPKELNWTGNSGQFKSYVLADWLNCDYPGHISAITFRNFNNFEFYEEYKQLIIQCNRNVADITLVFVLLKFGAFVIRDFEVSTYTVVSRKAGSNYTSKIRGKNANLDRNKHLYRIIKFNMDNFGELLEIKRSRNEVLAESILLLVKYPSKENFIVLKKIVANKFPLNEDEIHLMLVFRYLINLVWERIY
jgi:glycosyltransferase involved in cell wall biosynthesis